MKPRVWFDAEEQRHYDWAGGRVENPMPTRYVSGWGDKIALDFNKETIRFSIQELPDGYGVNKNGKCGTSVMNVPLDYPAIRVEWVAEKDDLVVPQGMLVEGDTDTKWVQFWIRSDYEGGRQEEVKIRLLKSQYEDKEFLKRILRRWKAVAGHWANGKQFTVEFGWRFL